MATNNVSLPEFFRVYLPYPSQLLLLPPAFNRHLPQPLPDTVIIRNSSGNFWRVGMARSQGYICFAHGWIDFVEDNELNAGEFMVFVYEAPRNFLVSIFGLSSCKEMRAPVVIHEISEAKEEDLIDVSDSSSIYSPESHEVSDEEEVILESPIPTKTRKFQASGEKGYWGTCFSWDEGSSSAREVFSIEKPERYLDDPLNPFFLTKLKNRNYELLIPARTVKDYNLKFSKTISFIDLQPHKMLKGEPMHRKDRRVIISNWINVCRRNKLKAEDNIICELIHLQYTVNAIKIHIIRG